MHLPDGLLPLPLTLGGYLLSFAIAAASVARLRRSADPYREVPRAALLTAAFFVASLIHFPIPPVSVHLLLNGLLGILLGWFAFPAILVGLALQAVMFGHGGITTLGVNALILGLPALAAFALLRLYDRLTPRRTPGGIALIGLLGGGLGVALALLLFALLLLGYLPAHLDPARERQALAALLIAYLPVILLEGVISALLLRYLLRVHPALLPQR